MAFEAAFVGLEATLRRLHEVFLDLSVTLSEDQPVNGQVSVAQRVSDSAENLRGIVRECLVASEAARHATAAPPDLDRIRRALATCQASYNRLVEGWISDLACYDRIEDISTIGRERGREWKAWCQGVRAALDQCRKPLAESANALLDTWRELVDRGQGFSVTVNASSVGRQFNVDRSAQGGDIG